MKPTFLVTGASGHLGRRVVELLLEADRGPVIATTREPAKLFDLTRRGAIVRKADFDDPESLRKAFAGADRILLISTDAIGRRIVQHGAAIKAATVNGARHIVYTSMHDPEAWQQRDLAQEHLWTERALKASGLGWTILRNNVYAESVLPVIAHAIKSGQIIGAAGQEGAGYVTREDCARAAAAAMLSDDVDGVTFEITGPSIVTHAQLARIAERVAGMPVGYVDATPELLRRSLIRQGFEQEVAERRVTLDAAVATGRLAFVTHAVEMLTGGMAASVSSLLAGRPRFWKSTQQLRGVTP